MTKGEIYLNIYTNLVGSNSTLSYNLSMIYLLSFMLPLLSLLAIQSNSLSFSLFTICYVFVLIPILDLLPVKVKNSKLSKHYLDLILNGVCVFYMGIFLYFLTKLPSMTPSEILFKSFAMGLSGGVIGINCAHELGHRKNKFYQFFSQLLLFTTSYTHFYIEHNKGHHKNVATLADPATSRLNETVYQFIFRSVTTSWVSALRIEAIKGGFYQNKVIQYTLAQIFFIFFLLAIDSKIFMGFILHSLVSIILLEAVNYIEHYGILRKKNPSGRFEKVTPRHSWNSDHLFSRIHLFELSRHSDHHALASKPFYHLESIDKSPQLPTGYAGMILLAFIPPLWFQVMNPKVKDYGFSS